MQRPVPQHSVRGFETGTALGGAGGEVLPPQVDSPQEGGALDEGGGEGGWGGGAGGEVGRQFRKVNLNE